MRALYLIFSFILGIIFAYSVFDMPAHAASNNDPALRGRDKFGKRRIVRRDVT
jgi:hypothetical protein